MRDFSALDLFMCGIWGGDTRNPAPQREHCISLTVAVFTQSQLHGHLNVATEFLLKDSSNILHSECSLVTVAAF